MAHVWAEFSFAGHFSHISMPDESGCEFGHDDREPGLCPPDFQGVVVLDPFGPLEVYMIDIAFACLFLLTLPLAGLRRPFFRTKTRRTLSTRDMEV
jgi:hypothetical protein